MQLAVLPAATTVSWSSLNTRVASVDATGLVAARDTGTAVILAVALSDARVRDSAVVRVVSNEALIPGPAITFTAITDPNGSAVDTAAVRGIIRVAFTVDAPPIFRGTTYVTMHLRDRFACFVPVPAYTGGPFESSCVVNTTEVPNGSAQLVAWLHRASDGIALAVAISRPLTIAN